MGNPEVTWATVPSTPEFEPELSGPRQPHPSLPEPHRPAPSRVLPDPSV